MAHNLNYANGKHSFVSGNNEKPWHNLGQLVAGSMTSDECIKLAGLDYTVEKAPVCAHINGQDYLVPDKYATYRSDTKETFGIVGNRYEIVQNKDAFNFFDSITGKGEAIYETAGALGKGEKVFITAKMPDYIRIKGTDDISEVYVLLTNTHDGSGSVIACVTPIRVVCQNTLNAAMKQMTNKISVRHTTNANYNLEQASKLMGITNSYVSEVNELFNHIAKKVMDDKTAKHLIEQIFKGEKEDSKRVDNIREAVWLSYNTGIGQNEIMGTGWGLYNGITHYLDHKEYSSDDIKFNSIISGDAAIKSNKALELILNS